MILNLFYKCKTDSCLIIGRLSVFYIICWVFMLTMHFCIFNKAIKFCRILLQIKLLPARFFCWRFFVRNIRATLSNVGSSRGQWNINHIHQDTYIPFTPIFQLLTLKKLTFLTVCAILQVQSNNEMKKTK